MLQGSEAWGGVGWGRGGGKGGKRGVCMRGARSFCGCREWKVNTSAHGVARTLSSTDESGSAFLVDMFCVFVGAFLANKSSEEPTATRAYLSLKKKKFPGR